MATAAAMSATVRALIRSIIPVPAGAECAEREECQPRRGQLQRKLSQAEHEDERRERPAHGARELSLDRHACAPTSSTSRTKADGREEQRVSRQSRFGCDLQVI